MAGVVVTVEINANPAFAEEMPCSVRNYNAL